MLLILSIITIVFLKNTCVPQALTYESPYVFRKLLSTAQLEESLECTAVAIPAVAQRKELKPQNIKLVRFFIQNLPGFLNLL